MYCVTAIDSLPKVLFDALLFQCVRKLQSCKPKRREERKKNSKSMRYIAGGMLGGGFDWGWLLIGHTHLLAVY